MSLRIACTRSIVSHSAFDANACTRTRTRAHKHKHTPTRNGFERNSIQVQKILSEKSCYLLNRDGKRARKSGKKLCGNKFCHSMMGGKRITHCFAFTFTIHNEQIWYICTFTIGSYVRTSHTHISQTHTRSHTHRVHFIIHFIFFLFFFLGSLSGALSPFYELLNFNEFLWCWLYFCCFGCRRRRRLLFADYFGVETLYRSPTFSLYLSLFFSYSRSPLFLCLLFSIFFFWCDFSFCAPINFLSPHSFFSLLLFRLIWSI